METIEINKKHQNFVTLIYYDGPKLQIDLENNYVLAWYDNQDKYEDWFLIELKQDLLEKYISNKIALLEILKEGNTFFVQRKYENYNLLQNVDKVTALNQYIVPDSDSYLGFDFTKEREYLEHLMKNYDREKHIPVLKVKRQKLEYKISKINYSSISKKDDTVTVKCRWENNEAA